jgi:hypothetical protein
LSKDYSGSLFEERKYCKDQKDHKEYLRNGRGHAAQATEF